MDISVRRKGEREKGRKGERGKRRRLFFLGEIFFKFVILAAKTMYYENYQIS